MPDTISIFGGSLNAADLALRKVLKFSERSGPLLVLDLTGRGAMILGESNRRGLPRRTVRWMDLADRRRPVSLFSLSQSAHFKPLISNLLRNMGRIYGTPLPERLIEWASEAACRLSKNGTISLGSLLRSFSSNDIRHWLFNAEPDANELKLLLEILAWAMRYPAVHAISEGPNRPDFQGLFGESHAIWIEAQSEHFERNEHLLVSLVAETSIENAARSYIANIKAASSNSMVFLHLYPSPGLREELPGWIKDTTKAARHISAHMLHARHAPKRQTLLWARNSSEVWVIGKTPILDHTAHSAWLTEQEIERINGLREGDLWVRSNQDGNALTVKVGSVKTLLNDAHAYRMKSSRILKIVPLRQLSIPLHAENKTGPLGLYSRLCEKETLRLGWVRVQKGRKDSRGSDNVTLSDFKRTLEDGLAALSEELALRKYRCRPIRRCHIPKPDGGLRPLGIACVRDRIVQSACLSLMEPIYEPLFSPYSFAFRPRRSAHQALAMARSRIASGHTWAVTADIKGCFDNIDHDILLQLCSEQISDPDLLWLIRHWLTVDVLDFSELYPIISGVPQGESLSPLLANIYLDPADKHLESLAFPFVRYADDIVVFTRTQEEATRAFEALKTFLAKYLRLEFKPSKSICTSIQDGIDFLGFKLSQDNITIKRRRTESALLILRNELQTLGSIHNSLKDRMASVVRINAVIRGFRNYFGLAGEPDIQVQMQSLDDHLEEIAARLLPAELLHDDLWRLRERFVNPAESAADQGDLATSEGSSAIGVYPESIEPAHPASWMTHGADHFQHETCKSSEKEVDMPDEEDQKELSGAVVEDNKRLFVLAQGAYLTQVGSDLLLKKRNHILYRRPLKEIELIFLQGIGMNVSVSLQIAAADLDIPIVFSPGIGKPSAVLSPVKSTRSLLRGQQILRREDPDMIAVGVAMIAGKISNQAAVLKLFAKYRKKVAAEAARGLVDAATKIRKISDAVKGADPSGAAVRSFIMGLEGQAAAIYWNSLMKLIPCELDFNGRVTRAAGDIVNQCLNYLYGILYGESWRAIVTAGLDPYFGIIHGSKRDQGSLVFDLIEEFRAPFADRIIIAMLGRGFKPALGKHGYLDTKTKKLLARAFLKSWSNKIAWRSRKMTPAMIMEKQAYSLAKTFSRSDAYYPFRMKW